MERHGEEVHIKTDEARGGSTPNIMRWVLGISLAGAIVLLSAIWIFGAATSDSGGGMVTPTEIITADQGLTDERTGNGSGVILDGASQDYALPDSAAE